MFRGCLFCWRNRLFWFFVVFRRGSLLRFWFWFGRWCWLRRWFGFGVRWRRSCVGRSCGLLRSFRLDWCFRRRFFWLLRFWILWSRRSLGRGFRSWRGRFGGRRGRGFRGHRLCRLRRRWSYWFRRRWLSCWLRSCSCGGRLSGCGTAGYGSGDGLWQRCCWSWLRQVHRGELCRIGGWRRLRNAARGYEGRRGHWRLYVRTNGEKRSGRRRGRWRGMHWR